MLKAPFKSWSSSQFIALARVLANTPHTFEEKPLLIQEIENHDRGAPNRLSKIEKLIKKLIINNKLDEILPHISEQLGCITEGSPMPTEAPTNPHRWLIDIQSAYPSKQTKRFMLFGQDRQKMLFPVTAYSKSTKARLQDRFKLEDAKQLIENLRTNETNASHFLLHPKKPIFFYGCDEGQRLCVQAHKFMQMHQAEINNPDSDPSALAEKLLEITTQEIAPQEKEMWRNVVNYWLAGSKEAEVGLAGERFF